MSSRVNPDHGHFATPFPSPLYHRSLPPRQREREGEREEFASLELKSMALRAVNFARRGEDPARTNTPVLFSLSLPPPFMKSWDRVSRNTSFETRGRAGREKNFRRKRLKKTRPSSIFLDSPLGIGIEGIVQSLSPPLLTTGPGCWTISSPLKLNSRSIRPLGRFCSNGSEINASFKCPPSLPLPRGSYRPSSFDFRPAR